MHNLNTLFLAFIICCLAKVLFSVQSTRIAATIVCNIHTREIKPSMKRLFSMENIFWPQSRMFKAINKPVHDDNWCNPSMFSNIFNRSFRETVQLGQSDNRHMISPSLRGSTDHFILINESLDESLPKYKFYTITDNEYSSKELVLCLLILAITLKTNVTQTTSALRKIPFMNIFTQRPVLVYPFSLNQYAKEIVTEQRGEEELMKFEWSRYLSFKNFPMTSIMTPMRLAQAGFYYTGQGEQVRCFRCGVTNSEWNDQENALQVHARISPNCEYISNNTTNNVPIHFNEYYDGMLQNIHPNISTDNGATGGPQDGATTDRDRDVVCSSSPLVANQGRQPIQQTNDHSTITETTNSTGNTTFKHPEYADVTKREESFKDWSLRDIQPPKQLALAGFFYTGHRDFVRCFCCGVGLKNWQRGDSPRSEHARWSPNCSHLKQTDSTKSHNGTVAQTKQVAPKNGIRNELIEKTRINTAPNQSCSQEARTIHEENRILRQQMSCKVCRTNSANTVFLPCGHMITCQACAVSLRECSHCKEQIKGTVRVYQS